MLKNFNKMKIKPKELESSGYILLDQLRHEELMVFLNEKNRSKGIFSYLFLLVLFIPIPLISFYLTFNIMTDKIGLIEGLLYCLLGIGSVFLFIPVHELLHALAYKVVGAKNISFYSNLKKMYFAAISDQSVINLTEFKIVALVPFLFVIIISLALFPFLVAPWQIMILGFVATHNLFCGGDFSLLNYMQNNKNRGIVTFDDKEEGETYFYIRKE
jgi:hypothetical protein